MTPTFIKGYEASADIDPWLIVMFSDTGASSKVAPATGNTAPLLGTADSLGAETGGMCDVTRAGIGEVKLGGPVSAGDPLTSDASAQAVSAAAAATTTIRIIGYADEPGVAGDVINYFVAPGLLHQG